MLRYINEHLQFTQDWFTPSAGEWPVYAAEILKRADGMPVHALEIGSFEGRSAFWLLENLITQPGSTLTSVDKQYHPNFWRNLGSYEDKEILRVRPMQCSSWEASKRLHMKFDFIYIDGNHSPQDVMTDACIWHTATKQGTVLVFDDALHRLTPTMSAIAAFNITHGHLYETIHTGYQVAMRRK